MLHRINKTASLFCLLLAAGSLSAADEVYAPEVGEGRYIVTPQAAASPRVNGPSIFGVRPGNPFLYAIPATGDRPMEFSVENLPAGLTVNPKNGHITGRITSAEKKTYNVTLRAKNSKGSDAKAFRIVVGEQIALTPPLGWNSWNCWHQKVSQAKVLESAKAMSDAGLQRVGWMYINMDDGWQAKRGGKHNAVMPNTKFPDMKGMVDEIHAMGFKAGIYHTPWVGSYAGYCGGSSHQKDGHDWPTDSIDGVGDQERYNYFHIGEHKFDKEDTLQWADWGIDYLKDDWVLARDITPAAVARRKEALQECGRDIVYSLSNTGPLKFADTFVNDSNAWRISADIRGDWDTRGKGAGSILAIMNLMKAWAPHCGPGHYPDADMMVVDGVHGGKPAKLTGDEQYTHVSLWSLWSSPMLLGSAVDKMGEFGLSILSNAEVLEIHQDALCNMATVKNSDPLGQVWVKPLENGDTAVGLINLADEPRVITADWSEIGVKGKQLVRDVWRQRNIQVFEGAFSAMVPSHGTILLRLSDPVAGTVANGEGMKRLPSAPRMTPDGGAFTGEATVSLKSASGATIHYTLDGSRPNKQSPIYTAPFKIASFTDVKAVAIKNGVESGVSSSQFFVAPKSIPEPDVDATTLEKTRSYAEWRDVNINKTGRYNTPFKYQGTVYQQGLGFYGAGCISYPLDSSYERFVAMACLDDFSVEGATGRFVVEIDGKIASASPIMKKGDPAWLFDVEIPKGAKTMTLLCYRDGVGPQFVFNYMNCGFIASGSGQIKTITPSADKPRLPEVALSDLNGLNVKNGWGQWQKNQNFNGQPLQIGGTVYKQGLGMHANAEITYALKPEWKRFVSTVGIHVSSGDKGSVQFIVEVDGKILGRSPVLTGKSPAHHFNITLPKGAQQIRLISSDGGDDITYDHVNWVNCGFSTSEHIRSTKRDVVYKTVNGTSVLKSLPEGTKAPSAPAFKPGQLWLDNNGVHINAHGGGVIFHEGTYYWYGEHKVAGTAGNRAQVGVHVYSSKDLCNWKDEGVALKVSDDPKSDIAKGCILERPKVIYNAKTGKFVMWFHLELKGQGYRSARSGIAVADKPCGPYKFVRSIRPNAGHWPLNVTNAQKDKASIERTKKEKDGFSGGQTPKHEQYNILGSHFEDGQMARDMNLFVDDDGKGYHIYSSEHNSTLHISQLTDDYLDHAGTYTRNFPFRWMEAPAVFKRGGKYYLIGSGCTGWNPNAARSAVADSILGPWKELGNPCIGTNPENRMGPNRTFGGQSTYVLKVHGKKDAYIAMFDIWRPNDAIDGRYIWLPIQFNEKGMTIEWSSEWDLDVFDDKLSAVASEGEKKILRDVVYKTVGETQVLMDIYYPAKKRERAPVFYYTHGGGWYVGSKKLDESQQQIVDRLLDAGVVCVSINYRLVSKSAQGTSVQMRDCVTDSKDGLRFLKKNAAKFGLNMSRVVTFGTSAGAHISLLDAYSQPSDFVGDPDLAKHSVSPVGCVSWSGPTDFTISDLFVPAGQKANSRTNRFTSRIKVGEPWMGYQEASDELKAMMREVSPVKYVRKDSPPVLQIHGDKDGTIPHKHALHLKSIADKVGAQVDVITVKGAGHGFGGPGTSPDMDSLIDSTVEFTLKQLFSEKCHAFRIRPVELDVVARWERGQAEKAPLFCF